MATNTEPNGAAAAGRPRAINYNVSGEPQETDQHKLTGREILEGAGFSPADEYKLTRDPSGKEIGLDDPVPIHDGESFTATFRGVTPTS